MLLVIEVEHVDRHPGNVPYADTAALAEAEAVVLVNPVTQGVRVWKWRHDNPPPSRYVSGKGHTAMWQVLDALVREVARQDRVHDTAPYRDDRDSVRVALAAMQDEVDEALEAFHRERREPANAERWMLTCQEALQSAALAVRLARDLGYRGGGPR